MEKVKLDIYEICYKKRKYQVIVFPKQEHMYVADGHPGEDGILFIDGDKDAYRQLKYAYAVLIQDPSKLLYFPCKHHDSFSLLYRMEMSDLVMYSSAFPFRRSYWFKIKDKLNKRHYKGKYLLKYEKEKLLDWIRKKGSNARGNLSRDWLRTIWKKYHYWAEDSSDVAFCQIPIEESYYAHKSICEGMEAYRQHAEHGDWLEPGYLYPDTIIEEIDRDTGNARKQAEGNLSEKVEEFRDMCKK